MSGGADRFCHGFVARKHDRPMSRIKRGYYSSQMLSHRTWGMISSSFSRQSGCRAEFALTEDLKVVLLLRCTKEMEDEPSKLRRSFRGIPSSISCLFSLISFTATSCAYAWFFRSFAIPGFLFLLESQVPEPFGAHLKASITKKRSFVGIPNASKLLKVNVTTGPVLKWKGSVRQVLIRLGELVVCIFQSAKVIVEGTCTYAGCGSVNTIHKCFQFSDVRIKRCSAEPRVYIDNRSLTRYRG